MQANLKVIKFDSVKSKTDKIMNLNLLKKSKKYLYVRLYYEQLLIFGIRALQFPGFIFSE